jgi:PPOX class probable F420-dependent enzyme
MDVAEAVEFVRTHHHAVLATRRRDGRPQLSPVAVAADDNGRLLISTRAPAMKTANIRREAAVSLCIFSDGFFGDWVQVDGQAEIVPLPAAMELLEFAYRQIAGDHPDWDEFRPAMQAQRRVALRVTPTSAGPQKSG